MAPSEDRTGGHLYSQHSEGLIQLVGTAQDCSCGPRTLVMVEPEPGMCTYKHTHTICMYMHSHTTTYYAHTCTLNHTACTHVYTQPHSMRTCAHIITQSRRAGTHVHIQPHIRHTSTTKHVHTNTPIDTVNCTHTPELSSSNTCPSVNPSPNSIC